MCNRWDVLDIELDIQKDVVDRNKDNPIVKLGYYERVVIWVDQILPDRINQIQKENTVEYVSRMISLLAKDFERLINAAERQLPDMLARVEARYMSTIYRKEILKYAAEITRIEAMHDN